MTPDSILFALRLRGFALEAGPDGKLLVTPPEGAALADEDRAAIVGAKEGLLNALWDEDTASADRSLSWPHESRAWDGGGFIPVPGGLRKGEEE